MNALTTLRASSFTVDKRTTSAYNRKLQSSLQNTVWNSGGCVSYFIDKNGRNSTNWPWTTFFLRQRLSQFKLGDYTIE